MIDLQKQEKVLNGERQLESPKKKEPTLEELLNPRDGKLKTIISVKHRPPSFDGYIKYLQDEVTEAQADLDEERRRKPNTWRSLSPIRKHQSQAHDGER